MSEDNESFGYSPLSDFMRSGFTSPNWVNVIPVYKIANGGDVYGVLGLNKNLAVTSLGMSYNRNKTLVTCVADALRFNSLGAINITDRHIIDHSFVAYSTSYDVRSGQTDLNGKYQPIVFVEITIDSIQELHDTIHRFRENFKSQMNHLINDSGSSIVALTYMDCTSMYYLFRFTTWKIIDSVTKKTHEFSIENDGLPALSFISETYKCDHSKGEIPVTDKTDPLANRCPEIEFYTKIDQNLGIAFTVYSEHDLPFMTR